MYQNVALSPSAITKQPHSRWSHACTHTADSGSTPCGSQHGSVGPKSTTCWIAHSPLPKTSSATAVSSSSTTKPTAIVEPSATIATSTTSHGHTARADGERALLPEELEQAARESWGFPCVREAVRHVFLNRVLISEQGSRAACVPQVHRGAGEWQAPHITSWLSSLFFSVNVSMRRGPRNELHSAAARGLTERTIAVDIDQGDEKGWTPLMLAAGSGHSRIVRILLNKGADTSAVNRDGITALLLAVDPGHLAVTKVLVKAGAQLTANAAAFEGFTPLHVAARKGHLEVMRVLMEAGANPNSRGNDGSTPMYLAAQEGKVDSIKVLLRAKANPLLTKPNDPKPNGGVPLDAAARNGHSGVVHELIGQLGIERCGGASGGVEALETAVVDQHLDIMAMLTDAGVVDTGAALRRAAGFGREACVKFLLQYHNQDNAARKRAFVNYRDEDGLTPLLCGVGFPCSASPSPRVVRMLVDAGADATSPVSLTNAAGRVKLVDTPLGLVNGFIRDVDGNDGGGNKAEHLLRRLEAIRRLLLRVEAVHAVSWLWQSHPRCVVRATEGASTTKATPASLAGTLPLLRRRAGGRGVPWATLFRWVVTS